MSAAYAEVLRTARALIEDEANWTKGEFARDAHGAKVPSGSTRACRWCMVGAVRHAIATDYGHCELRVHRKKIATLVIAALPTGRHCWTMVEFNDHRKTTHGDVLGVLDRAIEKAEEGP